MGNTKTVNISEISSPADLQAREGVVTDHVHDIAEAIQNGEELPPVQVVREGKAYWLWDGHHRLQAYRTAGVNKVPITVTQDGTRQDARWLACSANTEHTVLKRSNEDKRRAAQIAIEVSPKKSNRAIAEHVGVSHSLVNQIRGEKPSGQVETDSTSTRTGQDGKQYPGSKKKTASKSQTQQSQQDTDSDAYEEEGEAEGREGWMGEPEGESDPEADPNSLEQVQSDIQWLESQFKWLERQVRDTLGMQGSECQRPFCGRYSKLSVLTPIQQARRTLTNEMPVDGSPDDPVVKYEEVAK